MKDGKVKLRRAFALLRKKGYLARQNFECCGSCAGAVLGELAEKDPTKVGTVFYHRQEGQRLAQGAHVAHLHFGALGLEPVPDGDHVAVGWDICRTLAEAGLGFEWDGSADTCVKAILGKPPR